MNEIITAQNNVNNMLTSFNALFFFEPWLPVIDNLIVHDNLLETVKNTSFSLKPLIIGTLADECYDFVYGSTWGKPISTDDYLGLLILLFQENAFKIIQKYPPDSSGDQRPLVVRVCTQWVFVCSTRTFARKSASYSYVFVYPHDRDLFEASIACSDHACHGDELPYLFETRWSNLTDPGRRVSQSMATYWTNFATSQDPNEPLRPPLSWPRISVGNETYIRIQDPLDTAENYLKNDCDFWDEIGYKAMLSLML
jgi:para-nitrobenzyl esterase